MVEDQKRFPWGRSATLCIALSGVGHVGTIMTRTLTGIAPAWYGVKAFRLFSSADQAIAGMASHKRLGKSGRTIVDNTFSLVLGKGEDVDDGEWRNAPFSLELLDDLQQADVRMGTIRLYESNREDRPHFIDSIGERSGHRTTWQEC